MNYSVIPTPLFKKQFKRLLKKYSSLEAELKILITTLEEKPEIGINLGHGIHKIRLAVSSKGKGKSGGARVITYLITEDKEIYLIFIYDKGQLENIRPEQILEILRTSGLISH